MRKYIVHYGYGNRAYTDTRNARVLCRMYGENVTVTQYKASLYVEELSTMTAL